MKCLSLFSSVTIATCLGLNSFVPVAATENDYNYNRYSESTNQLRQTQPSRWTPQRSNADVPWYEKLPEFGAAETQSFASDDRRDDRDLPSDRYQARPSTEPMFGSVTHSNDSPFNFARQQHDAVVGEAEAIPQTQHAFDSMIKPDASYPQQGHPTQGHPQQGHAQQSYSHNAYPVQTEDWGSKSYWGGGHGVGNSLRQRLGARNRGGACLWRAAADFYYLKRTTTSPVTILVDDTTRSIEEFNAQALDFDHNLGYGVRLSRDLGCGTSLNFRYFGVYDQSAAIERTGDLALVLPGFATGGNPAAYNSDYQSQLHSGAINIRQNLCGRFGLLAGLRYINLQEDLLISSQLGAVVTPDHLDIDTDNDLFGAQFGTDICMGTWGRWTFDALVMCGFYWNNASQTTRSSLIGQPLTATNDAFAAAGEAGIFATYCVNDCWSIRAGYQVLGFHGLALAPEQLQQSNLATDTANIDTSGSAFYSGASLGVQYAW